MIHRRAAIRALAGATMMGAAAALPAAAAPQLEVIASFSILADMVREVGGPRVRVRTIVGADGDMHNYRPRPADVRAISGAGLLVVNGLGFEGWISRLIDASGYRGPVVTATDGIAPLGPPRGGDGHGHDDRRGHDEAKGHGEGHGHGHDEAKGHGEGHGHGHGHGEIDPHAWQDPGRAAVYVRNIAAGLGEADPAGREGYERRAGLYLGRLAALDREIRDAIGRLPPERRKVVTSHDAFGYFADAYGIAFLAPAGFSTRSEASAADVARLIRQIRHDGIRAVFLQNITDRRLLDQIASQTGARIGGVLYSDALSGPDGPAPTYIGMIRHNLRVMMGALGS